MLSELLQDRAALYVSGAMTAPEREGFELLLEYHGELRAHVTDLMRVGTAVVLAGLEPAAAPAGLKSRLLAALSRHPQSVEADAVVVTDPAGRLEWVNPSFTRLCGYELSELKGRKPGDVLQGPETETATVERIRSSVRNRRSCRETLTNYHKDGTRYRVDIAISPILDDAGEPLWFVAKERKLCPPSPVTTHPAAAS